MQCGQRKPPCGKHSRLAAGVCRPAAGLNIDSGSAEDRTVTNHPFSPLLSQELTDSDCALLRSFRIQPPSHMGDGLLTDLSPDNYAHRLSTPLAWIGLATLLSGAIVLCCWMTFLIQKLDL